MPKVHVEEWIDKDILSKSENKASRLRQLITYGLLYEQLPEEQKNPHLQISSGDLVV